MKRFLVVVLSIECAIAGWLVADRLLTVRPPGGRPEFFFNSSDSLRDVLPAEWDRVVASVATEDTPEAWLELISFYLTIGYYPEAEVCGRYASGRWPNSFPLAYSQGICLHLLGRMRDAIAQFERANQLIDSDRDHRCWFLIGQNWLRLEDPERALEAFFRGKRFPPVALWGARTLLRRGRVDEVLQLIEYLRRVKPDAYEVDHLSAEVAEMLGDQATAVRLHGAADRAEPFFSYQPIKMATLEFRTVYMVR